MVMGTGETRAFAQMLAAAAKPVFAAWGKAKQGSPQGSVPPAAT